MAKRIIVDISDDQYRRAIQTLESGGTKKAACDILGIKYNTTRLDSLIADFLESETTSKKLRQRKRGTPVDNQELATMIEMYFENSSLEDISKRLHRSILLIKYHLESSGANLKSRSAVNPLNPPLIPEVCMQEHFKIGESVWVAGYNCLGEIKGLVANQDVTTYKIYLLDKYLHRTVYYAWYELGSLSHLAELGVNISGLGSVMDKAERDQLLHEAFKKAKMRAKDEAR